MQRRNAQSYARRSLNFNPRSTSNFWCQAPNRHLTELKREGYMIGSQRVPMAKIIARMNKYAGVIPPAELPTREILMMEYWIKS